MDTQKFANAYEKTVVKQIMIQVGRTGILTPKAVVEPIQLGGATVTAIALHDQAFISENDIRVGDTVLIRKAGARSAEIVGVDHSKRPEGAQPFFLPLTCPVCGCPVVRDARGAAMRCTS